MKRLPRVLAVGLIAGLVVCSAGCLIGFLVPAALPAAHAADVPADPRITAAVARWKTSPIYLDPLFAGSLGEQANDLRRSIDALPVPVYVAVIPTGQWFAEKGDTVRLAGWLAVANGKPGVYVVVDRTTATGAAHLVRAHAPGRVYDATDYTTLAQLEAYLKAIRMSDRYDPEPARTDPLPEPEWSREPDRFTVGSALANGFGGLLLGAVGGAVAAGLVVALAALVALRREGPR